MEQYTNITAEEVGHEASKVSKVKGVAELQCQL